MKTNKFLVIVMFCLISISMISAISVTRSVPATTSAPFSVTYTVTGVPSGDFAIAITDTVSGGCLFTNGKSSTTFVLLTETSSTKTISVPSSGSCSFSGDFDAALGSSTSSGNLNSATVTIGTNSCTANNACASSTCTGSTCVNNCGTTIQGTKSCGTGTSPPSFDINKVIFYLGSFGVTILHLLILAVVLFIAVPILKGK